MDFLGADAKSITLVSEEDDGMSKEVRRKDLIDFTISGEFVMMPHSAAMACAVRAKSPVT